MSDTPKSSRSIRDLTDRGGRVVSGLAAVLVAAAAALATTAPPAAADVTGLNADPGASWGPNSRYGTNCTYTLSATINAWQPVSFYDYTEAATFSPSNYIYPSTGTVTVEWTPTRPGWHRVIAYQTSAGGPAIDLLVGAGINTGSACLVLP